AQHRGGRVDRVDVEADRRGAVGVDELGGGVLRVGADGQRALLGDLLGQQRGDLLVGLHGRRVERGGGARVVRAVGRSAGRLLRRVGARGEDEGGRGERCRGGQGGKPTHQGSPGRVLNVVRDVV